MKFYETVIDGLSTARERLLSGDVNCIPCPYERFRDTFPGLEQSSYIIVTASTKIGKTQLGDAIALYNSFIYAFNNRDKIRVKIFYFSLEMSKDAKWKQFMCYLLYMLSRGTIRIDTKSLRSLNTPLPEPILNLLKSPEYKPYLDFFEEHVEIISDIKHPTGIFKICESYSKQRGNIEYKTLQIKDNAGNVKEEKQVFSRYVPNDSEEYRICIVDHYSLFTTESGLDLKGTINKFSSVYALSLRDDYKWTIIGIQQQAAAQESNDNQKLGKLKPTLDGLAECKTTGRDGNYILGLYSPYRYGIREYCGYDITKFKDNIRFLEVLAGREGGGGDICPLYFDGAVNYFKELPKPDDRVNLERVYNLIAFNNRSILSTAVALIAVSLKQSYFKKLINFIKNLWQ